MNNRVVSSINNSFLRGISSMIRSMGTRESFLETREQLNEAVDKVVLALDTRESTRGLEIKDLLNLDILSKVVDEDEDNLMGQFINYVEHNTDQIHGYKALGIDLEGYKFGDLNLMAYDLMNLSTQVISHILDAIKDIREDKATDLDLVEMLKAAIVYLNSDKINHAHFYKEKGIPEPEEGADFIFGDEYDKWVDETVTRVLTMIMLRPNNGIFVSPKGVEEAKKKLLEILPSDKHELVEQADIEEILTDDFTALMIRSIVGKESINEIDIKSLDPSVTKSLIDLQAIFRDLYQANNFQEIEIGKDEEGNVQKVPLPSTTNLSELIYGMILSQSAKLHDKNLTEEDLNEDGDFSYIYGLYSKYLFDILGDEKFDKSIVYKVMSTFAVRTQLVVFLNIVTRIKDQEVHRTLSFIQQLIHEKLVEIKEDKEEEGSEE